jgi:hypothetical protein
VRGQNVPDGHACGMQKVAELMHLSSAPHAAPPGQSLAVVQTHRPESASQVPDGQSAFVAQTPASAQFCDSGGYAAGSPVLRWPIQIGCEHALVNVYVYCVDGSHAARASPTAIASATAPTTDHTLRMVHDASRAARQGKTSRP